MRGRWRQGGREIGGGEGEGRKGFRIKAHLLDGKGWSQGIEYRGDWKEYYYDGLLRDWRISENIRNREGRSV
jgi:hypothetical protein